MISSISEMALSGVLGGLGSHKMLPSSPVGTKILEDFYTLSAVS